MKVNIKMEKKQKYILIIILSFIIIFILTSIVSYQKDTYYHNLNGDYYLSITGKYIQPFYNTAALFIWFTGIFFLILLTRRAEYHGFPLTYLYFRNYDDPVYKKYLVDYKLIFKSLIVFIAILFFIGIFGEFHPSFNIGDEEIYLITKTEFEEKTNMNDSDLNKFNKENWIEI